MEAAWPRGVVDAGVRRHGGQAQGGARRTPWRATSSTRSSTAPRRASGAFPGAFTFSASFFTSVFSQLSSASQSAAITEQWRLVQS
jgi:hypothetical protein